MSSDQLVVVSTNSSKKYEVLEELGSGMHAVVFRARSTLDGDFYALKVSRKTRLRSKRDAQNKALLNETEILKTLSHKNIIKFFEVFEESSQIHVVLDLIVGGELFHYLSLHKGITEWESQNFARQILNGICYIHSLNIAHLDLKPENIMIKNITTKELVIVDFSLSRIIKPNDKIQIMQGTVEFSAPEIFNYEYVGLYTDMWSFGVMLYILLSGVSPFLGESVLETQANICAVDVPYDIPELTNTSKSAINLLKSLLMKEKKTRLTSLGCLNHIWFRYKNPIRRRSESYIGTSGLTKYLSKNSWHRMYKKLGACIHFNKQFITNKNHCAESDGIVSINVTPLRTKSF